MPAAIPEAVLLIGAFFLLVAAMFLRGGLAGYNYSFGSIFRWMHNHLRLPLPAGLGHIDFGAPFGYIDKAIVGALQAGIKDCEKYLAYTWHAAEKMLRYTTQMVDWLARETEASFHWLEAIKLPKWAKWAIADAFPPALLYKLIAQALPHVLPHIERGTKVIYHTLPVKTITIIRKAAGAALPLPPWVIRLPHRLGRLERDATHISRRLRKVEGIFAAGVFAAVLANALGVATKCIRRGNVGKAARSICGFDPSLLESLLADGLAIVGVLSVVEFANELRAIEGEALKILGAGIREWPS